VSQPAILESVAFRLRPGVDAARFHAADEAAQAFLAAAPGFIARTLASDEDGSFLDLVWWTDRPSALAAAEAYIGSPAGRAMSELIDASSLGFRHLALVRDAPERAAA
jgi:hypothetical protein